MNNRVKTTSISGRPGRTRSSGIVLISSIIGMLGFVAGCMTIEQIAPPVSAEVVVRAEEKGFNQAQIERGRSIYLNECIDCHGPRPVTDYTVAQWISIMAEMAPKSELDEQETEDVKAYVLAAREWALEREEIAKRQQQQH